MPLLLALTVLGSAQDFGDLPDYLDAYLARAEPTYVNKRPNAAAALRRFSPAFRIGDYATAVPAT